MAELRALREEAGFSGVQTYIQSRNVVFRSRLAAPKVKATLEAALAHHLGKPVGVLVTGAELERVLERNPFPEAEPTRVIVFFYDAPLPGMRSRAGVFRDGSRCRARVASSTSITPTVKANPS